MPVMGGQSGHGYGDLAEEAHLGSCFEADSDGKQVNMTFIRLEQLNFSLIIFLLNYGESWISR